MGQLVRSIGRGRGAPGTHTSKSLFSRGTGHLKNVCVYSARGHVCNATSACKFQHAKNGQDGEIKCKKKK